MDTRLILTVTILVAVALLILAFLPHRVYVDFPENADGWPLSAEKDTNAAGQ